MNSFGHIREVLRFLDQHHPRRHLLQITDEATIWQDGTDLLEAKLVNEND